MSSKNRDKGSQAQDKYFTPRSLVRAGFDMLMEHHGDRLLQVKTMLEPGVGRGPFCYAAEMYCPNLKEPPVGVDLFPEPAKDRYTKFKLVDANFRTWKTRKRFDLVATNPPFTFATEFIERGAELLTPNGLGFYLMRLGVCAGVDRQRMWRRVVNLKEVWTCVRRPGFTYDGHTDSSEYAFFLFDNSGFPPSCNVRMRWIEW
jgi:hypothetical protein